MEGNKEMKRIRSKTLWVVFCVLLFVAATNLVACGPKWVSIKKSELQMLEWQLEDAQMILGGAKSEDYIEYRAAIDEALYRVNIALDIVDDAIRRSGEY